MSKQSVRKSVADLNSQIPSDLSVQQSKEKKPMISCHCPPSNLVGGQSIDGQTPEKKGEKKKVKKLTKYDCKTVDITPFFIYLLTLHLNQGESQEQNIDGSLKNCCQTSNFLLKKIIDKVATVTQVPMGACGNCFNQECVDKNYTSTCCQCNKSKNDTTCCHCNKPKNDAEAKSCQCNDMPTHENCFNEFDQKYGNFYNKLTGFLENVKGNDENFQHAEPNFNPYPVNSYSSCQCRNKQRKGAGENILEKIYASKPPRRTKFSDDRFESVPDYDNHENDPINEDELKKVIDRIIRDCASDNKMKEKLSPMDAESTETVKKSETNLEVKESQNKYLTNEDVESIIKKEMEKYFQKYYEELNKNNCVCKTNKEPSKPFEMANIYNNKTAQVSHKIEENSCKFQNDHPPPILGSCLQCGCQPEKSNTKTKTCIQRVPSDVMYFLQEEGAPIKKECPIKKNIKQNIKQDKIEKPKTRPNTCQDDVRICHEKHKDLSMGTSYDKTKEKLCICSNERERPKTRKINNMTCYFSDDHIECSRINRGTSPICNEPKCICDISQQTSIISDKKVENKSKPDNIIQINEAPIETDLPFAKTESSKCQKQILFEDSSPIGWEPMVVQPDSYQKPYQKSYQKITPQETQQCKFSKISKEPNKKSEINTEKYKPVELTHSYHQGVHKFTHIEPKQTRDVKPNIYNKEQNEKRNVYTPNTYKLKNTESKTGPVYQDSIKYKVPVIYENNQKSKTTVNKDTSMKYKEQPVIYENNQKSKTTVCKDTSMNYKEQPVIYENNQKSKTTAYKDTSMKYKEQPVIYENNQKSKTTVCKDTSMNYKEQPVIYENNQKSKTTAYKDTSMKYKEQPVIHEDNQKSKVVCKDREKRYYEQNYHKGDLSEVEEYGEEEELLSHQSRKGGNFYVQNKIHTMKRDSSQKKYLEEKALEAQIKTSFSTSKNKKPMTSNLRPIIPPKTMSKRTPELDYKGTSDNLYADQKQEELDEIRSKYYKRHEKCFQNAEYSKNKLGLGTRNINLNQSEYEHGYSEGESYRRDKKIYNQYNVSIHKKPIYFSYESQIEMNQKPLWRAVDDVISGNDIELEPNLTSKSYDSTNDENTAENYESYNEINFDKNSSDESQDRSKSHKNRSKFEDRRVQRTDDKRINPVLIEWSNQFEQEENVENNLSEKSAEIEEESTTSSSEQLSVFNRPLSPIPEAECENSSESNSVKNEAPREVNTVKRLFSFSRKKDESEQQSKRKTIKEFILGIKKDIARKKSLAQKQDENES